MTSNKSWADMTEDGDVLTKSTDTFRFSTDTYNSPDDAAAVASFSSDPIPVDIPKPKATVTQQKKEETQHATQYQDVHAIPQHHYSDQHDHRDRDYQQHRNRDDQYGQERGHHKNNYQKPHKQRGNNKNDNYNHHHAPHSPNAPLHHQQAPHSPQQFPPYPPQQFPNVIIPALSPSPVIKPVRASSGAGLLDPASGHQYGSPNPLSPKNPLRGFHELSPKVAPRGAPEGLVPVTVLKAPGFGGPPGFETPSFAGASGRGHDDFGGGRGHDNFGGGRGHDNFGGRGGGNYRGGRGGRGRNQNYGHDDRGPRESAPADTSFGRGGGRGAPGFDSHNNDSEYGFHLGAER